MDHHPPRALACPRCGGRLLTASFCHGCGSLDHPPTEPCPPPTLPPEEPPPTIPAEDQAPITERSVYWPPPGWPSNEGPYIRHRDGAALALLGVIAGVL